MDMDFSNILDSFIEQKFEQKIAEIVQKEVAKKITEKLPKLYSREETMELFDISETTLWHWNNKEILIQIKVGKRVYYTEDEIKRVLGQSSNI